MFPVPDRLVIIGVTILALLVGAFWYVSSLKSTITNQQAAMVVLQSNNDKLKLEIALQVANNNALKNAVKEQNDKVKEAEGNVTKIQAELTLWINKPAEIKYVNRDVYTVMQKSKEPTKDLGKDCIDMTNIIKGIKYEDL